MENNFLFERIYLPFSFKSVWLKIDGEASDIERDTVIIVWLRLNDLDIMDYDMLIDKYIY